MDPVAFALMENGRPQARIDQQDATNAQTFQQIIQGAGMFQKGAISQNELAQQKQLTMAQMSQNQSQFNALQSLRQQEFEVNSQKSMADIAQMHAATEMDITQQKLLQNQADLVPQLHANQAFITQTLADPKSKDPATGSNWVMSQMANAPYPEALTDLDRKDALATNDLSISQSSLGIAAKQNLTSQLNIMGEAAQSGLPMQNYVIDKSGNPALPTTYDIPKMAADVNAIQVNRQKSLIQTQAQGRIDVAKIQSAARTDTGKAVLNDLSRQAIEADKSYGALQKQFPPATTQALQAAKTQRDAAYQKYSQAAGLDTDGDSAISTPGATGSTMQNPNGTATAPVNPAANFWNTNMSGSK